MLRENSKETKILAGYSRLDPLLGFTISYGLKRSTDIGCQASYPLSHLYLADII